MTNAPRDCTHPDFPLRQRSRTLRGKPYAEWVKKIRKVRISFGTCSNDPTGLLAWRLYEVEKDAWAAKKNPRALPFCRSFGRFNPAWFIAGPLAKFGVAIIDMRHGTLMCVHCMEKWSVRFDDAQHIPKRLLKCPGGCDARPLAEVTKAIAQAAEREPLPIHFYERMVKAHANGWRSAPLDIDHEAEIEGDALRRFAQLVIKRRSHKRKVTLSRIDAAQAISGSQIA